MACENRSDSAERRGERAEYVVFDLETTGLGDRCQIVEFAAIVLDHDLRLRDCYETLVNPDCLPGPTWLHGLDRATLTLAPLFEEVAGDVEHLFRDRIVVAHNLRFDWSVLRRAFGSLCVYAPATCGGVCTANVSRRLLGGMSGLRRVCGRLGVHHGELHRALHDVTATVGVFRALRDLAPEETSGRPCPVFSGAWRLRRSLPPVRRADVMPMLDEVDPLIGG